MRSLIFAWFILAFLAVGIETSRRNWILLIAGSNTWENYRHQADICHAHGFMHWGGIPNKQIVVMMYDDIAYNKKNPFKGNVANRINGFNYYLGMPKDYTGDEVNAEIFLAALQGDKETIKNLTGRDKKVVDSGPEDHIFVFFAGLGGPGYLGMPKPPYLKARDLNNALKSMHANKRFSKMIIYVESSESGSIFENILPTDINVYATTSTNPFQKSYPCYYDARRKTYVGDVYSVNWLEDSDMFDGNETFENQYKTIMGETTTSDVMQYGNTSIAECTLGQFIFNFTSKSEPEKYSSSNKDDAIESEKVRVQTMRNRIKKAPIESYERVNLERDLKFVHENTKLTQDLFSNIARTVYRDLPEEDIDHLAFRKRSSIKDWGCYEAAVDTLTRFCPGIYDKRGVALSKFYVLVNLCNDQDQGKVVSAVETAVAGSPICLKDIV